MAYGRGLRKKWTGEISTAINIARSWEELAKRKEEQGRMDSAESYWRMAAGYYRQGGSVDDADRCARRSSALKIEAGGTGG
jgi:hypothetical protein